MQALPEPPELAEVEELCKSLLAKEQQLISELEASASRQASEAACKREMLYHKWSTRVFAPLHSRITSVMGGSLYKNLDCEKRILFENYLNYCNTQRVFLETVSSEGYNPLSPTVCNTHLMATTGPLDDPLLTQATDRDREQQIATCSCSERGVIKSERGLDAVSWLAVQLVFVDSSVRERSRCRILRDHNERQTGEGYLVLPHKTPAMPLHRPFSLTWPDPQ